MKRWQVVQRLSALGLSVLILVGLAFSALGPFFVGTAGAAAGDPSSMTTIIGGDFNSKGFFDPNNPGQPVQQGKTIKCLGYFEQAPITSALGSALGFSYNDLKNSVQNGDPSPNGHPASDAMWNFSQSDKPGNFNTYNYNDYLAQEYSQNLQVSVLGLYDDPSAALPQQCGASHTAGSLGSPHLIMVPVAGNTPTDPTVWAAKQVWNYESSYETLYAFFEKTGTTSDGKGTIGNYYIFEIKSGIGIYKETGKTVGGVPTPSASQVISTNVTNAQFIDIATIAVTMTITDPKTNVSKEVHEVYKDHNWDKYSYYFLENTDDTDRQGLTYSAQGVDMRYDPRCHPTDHHVPFIWIKSGDAGDHPTCDDWTMNAINLNEPDKTDSLQRKVGEFGHFTGGLNPQIFNYASDGQFVGGPDPVIAELPVGRDVQLGTFWANLWFYVNGDHTIARTVWQSGDGNEQKYIGAYDFDPTSQKFLLQSAAQCAIGVADVNFGAALTIPAGAVNSGDKVPINWTLRADNCTDPFQIANVAGLVNQSIFDSTTPTPPPPPDVDNSICGQNNIGGLGWFFCAIVEQLQNGLQWMEAQIQQQLHIQVDTIFGSSGQDFHRAWTVFRNMAYALLVILGLIMVVSQIMGLEFFDAYAIRKMLPKIVIVTILIPLLWPILHVLLQMSNDAADAVNGLITAPFQPTSGSPTQLSANDMTFSSLLFGGGNSDVNNAAGNVASIAGLFAGGAFLAIGGWGVALAMVASGALAVAVAYITLVIRDMIVYGFVIMSAVIINCTIFAPTAQAASKAIRAIVAAVIVQILVMFYLSLGKVAAWIAYTAGASNDVSGDPAKGQWWGTILAIIFLAVSYVMAWKYFQQAFQWSKTVNALTEKAQKALANYRGESRKKRLNEAVEGRRKFGGFLGKATGASWAANRVAGLVRRGRMSGEVGAGAFFGSTKYKEALRTMQAGVAGKMVEQDKNRAGGDDDAMRLLGRRGMTERRFLRDYADIQQKRDPTLSRDAAEQRARAALGLSESSLGAKAGTSAMRIAAQMASLKSNTSYRTQMQYNEQTGEWEIPKKYNEKTGKWEEQWMDFDTMSRTMYGDVAELVNDGLITAADGAAMIKSNPGRADRAAGFGATLGQLQKAATGGTKAMDTSVLLDDILSGNGAGQMAGQRHEGARILAPEMLKRAQAAAERDKKTVTRVEPDGRTVQVKQRQLGREFVQQVALAAGRIDIAGQLPELNAELMASSYIGAGLEGKDSPTMAQWVDFFRMPPARAHEHPVYKEMYAIHEGPIRAAEGAKIEADVRAKLPAPTTPEEAKEVNDAVEAAIRARIHRETEGQIADAQRVFNEYRREYGAAWQAEGQQQPEAAAAGAPK